MGLEQGCAAVGNRWPCEAEYDKHTCFRKKDHSVSGLSSLVRTRTEVTRGKEAPWNDNAIVGVNYFYFFNFIKFIRVILINKTTSVLNIYFFNTSSVYCVMYSHPKSDLELELL